MAINASGVTIKLSTPIGVFDSELEYERARWSQTIQAERQRQIEKGYTAEHDDKHGIEHLINWAIEYDRLGEPVKSSALKLAVLEALKRQNTGPNNETQEN